MFTLVVVELFLTFVYSLPALSMLFKHFCKKGKGLKANTSTLHKLHT